MLKNMKIGKKLIITFILVAMLSSIGGIVGLIVMTNSNAAYSKALTDYGFAQGDIGLFNTEFNNSRSILRDVISTNDAKENNAYSAQLSQSNAKVDTYFANMKKGMVTEKELNYYNSIKNNLAKFATAREQIVALGLQDTNTEAQTVLTTQATPLSDQIRADTNSLISEKSTVGKQTAAKLSSEGTAISIFIFAIILASLIISLIIVLSISRGISKPVKEMADAAQRMSEGDLSVQIHLNSKDEIGQLASALSRTIETINTYITDIKVGLAKVAQGDLTVEADMEFKGDFLELQTSIQGIVSFFNEVVTQMRQAAEQVSSGSEQVSSGAQALAQGATEQASAVEELSASIMEISSHVKENVQHATIASENVNQVSAEIEISNKHMSDMVVAMSQINDSSSQIGNH